MFDSLDFLLIDELQKNARKPITQLARKLGLPVPTIRDRIKRLEKKGVIMGYSAVIDLTKIGLPIQAIIQIGVSVAVTNSSEFLAALGKIPEVENAYLVTGDFEAVVLLHVKDVEHLRRVIYEEISRIPGASGIQTMIVLSEGHWKTPRQAPLLSAESSKQ
jgi:DNA-binding Lrp family transcriptional regulator